MSRYRGMRFRRHSLGSNLIRSLDEIEEGYMSKKSDDRHDFEGWFGNNRMLCDVLEDMRRCDKTKNYSSLAGLVEEAQVMGYRMESALADQKDLIKLQQRLSEARKAYRDLEREYNQLYDQVAKKRPKKS